MLSSLPSREESQEFIPTKGTMIHFRNQETSEAARHYRREEMLKKKIKSVVELNTGMEKDIKTQEEEIRDERAGVVFQLSELVKETALKYGYFVEQRLHGGAFSSNESAHMAMREMMGGYEKIEKECLMLGRIYDTLAGISNSYQRYSKHIESTVIEVQQKHQEYERNIEQRLAGINAEIQMSEDVNSQTTKRTDQLTREIDEMVEGVERLKEEGVTCLAKIDRLKKIALRQQERVEEMAEWSDLVVDKNKRKLVFKTMREKKDYLGSLSKKNQLLEMELRQLEQEQKHLALRKERQKQNQQPVKPVKTAKKKANRNK